MKKMGKQDIHQLLAVVVNTKSNKTKKITNAVRQFSTPSWRGLFLVHKKVTTNIRGILKTYGIIDV